MEYSSGSALSFPKAHSASPRGDEWSCFPVSPGKKAHPVPACPWTPRCLHSSPGAQAGIENSISTVAEVGRRMPFFNEKAQMRRQGWLLSSAVLEACSELVVAST